MKIEKFASEINQQPESEINTLPVLSLLMILIPFLLLTTVFVDTSVFELHLPAKGKARADNTPPVPLKTQALFIFVDEKGLRLGTGGAISGYFRDNDLSIKLEILKEKFTEKSDITLVSSPQIRYQKIVDIITLSNKVGFTRISVADEENFFRDKSVTNQGF